MTTNAPRITCLLRNKEFVGVDSVAKNGRDRVVSHLSDEHGASERITSPRGSRDVASADVSRLHMFFVTPIA